MGKTAMSGPVAAITARLPELLDDIGELVTCESPSADLAAVARSAGVVSSIGERLLGVAPERIVIDGRTHLRWRFDSADINDNADINDSANINDSADINDDPGINGGPGPGRVLLLGHHDTVWPLGSLQTHPFSACDGVLRGPGCFDMKAGLIMALHAASMQKSLAGVTILVTGDEEVGSPSSRALIEAEAAGSGAALVLEASADGGALKTARKGTSLYHVRAVGRAAHSGLEPERGVNATVELAHQVLAVTALADPGRGTTVTPTAMSAGTAMNTVPAAGEFAVDVRMWDSAEQQRVDATIRGLMPVVPDAVLEVSGGPNRPPLPASASGALFARACEIAAGMGLSPLTQAAVGGASDGNFTAGVGTATLDGLGAVGGGAHADHEHVLIDHLPGRTALLAALIGDLLHDRPLYDHLLHDRRPC